METLTMVPRGFKLIRDRILKVISDRGEPLPKHARVDVNTESYRDALKDKLLEEVEELLNARERGERLEEMADIREVLDALVESEGASSFEFGGLRERKRADRGGFREGIVAEFPPKANRRYHLNVVFTPPRRLYLDSLT